MGAGQGQKFQTSPTNHFPTTQCANQIREMRCPAVPDNATTRLVFEGRGSSVGGVIPPIRLYLDHTALDPPPVRL